MLVIEQSHSFEDVELELGYVRGYTENAMVTNCHGALCVVRKGYEFADDGRCSREFWRLVELRLRER